MDTGVERKELTSRPPFTQEVTLSVTMALCSNAESTLGTIAVKGGRGLIWSVGILLQMLNGEPWHVGGRSIFLPWLPPYD